jgi:hypothetical protein
VIGLRTRLHWADATDWDGVCRHIAAAEPWWDPGSAQGYHMVTFGFILGEVVREPAHVRPRRLGWKVRVPRELEHRIGYAYVMNYFEATKCNADPRSVALSD